MGYSNSTVAHRWANRDLGKNGELHGSNLHAYHDTIESYSTVVAKFMADDVVVISDVNISTSTGCHISDISRAIPTGIHVIWTHRSAGSWSYYVNTNFYSGEGWGVQMVNHLVSEVEREIKWYKTGKTISQDTTCIWRWIDDIKTLYQKKYWNKAEYKGKYGSKALSRLEYFLNDHELSKLVDYVCGRNAWSKYLQRIESLRKADKTRNFVNWVNSKCLNYDDMKASQIRRMMKTKEGVHILVNMMTEPAKPKWETDKLRWWYKDNQNHRINKFMTGDEHGIERDGYVRMAKSLTGEKLNWYGKGDTDLIPNWFDVKYNNLRGPEGKIVVNFMWDESYKNTVYINYDDFKASADKFEYRRRTLQKCQIADSRMKALKMWFDVFDGRLNIDDFTQSELDAYNRVALKYSKFREDEEARKQAEEEEKKRQEEERIRKEQKRNEKYESYIALGVEGYRKLWIENLDVHVHVPVRCTDDEFFYNGNVLLRWKTPTKIETSKGIVLTIEQAEVAWKKVSEWHNDPTSYSHYLFKTSSGDYRSCSYKDDVLVAGCHRISYCEMERIMSELPEHKTA